MFGKNKETTKVEKLPGPKVIPGLVQKYLTNEKKIAADMAQILKAVVRQSDKGKKAFSIRIFDESEALAKKIAVKDFTTLDAHPDLILYDGWFDDDSGRIEMEEKKKFSADTTIFTEAELLQKIEALKQPDNVVSFYQARGGKHGGPLGMGAAVIELNPGYPGKKQKKYNVYTADVIDMQPVGKGDKLFDSDKAKDVARWVKEGHVNRLY